MLHPAPRQAALSIAGFDPCGAAGVLADLKTFAAHDCYGVAAVAAITAQNTREIRRVAPVDSGLLKLELQTLFDDVPVAGVKVGLLGSRRNMEVAAEALAARRGAPVVIDPVLYSSAGTDFVSPQDLPVFLKVLLPLARVLTPSAEEAGRLLGTPVSTVDDMKGAARLLYERGVPHVVVKGQHLERPCDVYFDGQDFEVFQSNRGEARTNRGVGCTFSSAILVHLIEGKAVRESIVLAKAYLSQAISRGYPIGSGPSPLNHLYRFADAGVRAPGPDLVDEVPQP